MADLISFARRQNHDSSVNSICTKCYQTIGSTSTNKLGALTIAERNHRCDPNGEFNHLNFDYKTSGRIVCAGRHSHELSLGGELNHH